MPEQLGILVSEKCAQNLPEGKRWFHVARFIKAYGELLGRFELLAVKETASRLETLFQETRHTSRPTITSLGSPFEGVVRLAAKVARKEVTRVLVFQDPRDLQIERAEAYALLRNCNISGGKMYFNAAAHLWALFESTKQGLPVSRPYYKDTVNTSIVQETVVFIAHDNEKPRMSRFALHYRDILRRFRRLLATAGTKKAIDAFLKQTVPPHQRLHIEAAGKTDQDSHGPSGGDVVVAEDVLKTYATLAAPEWDDHVLHHILFFIDHKHSQPHEPDIQVLLKTCADPRNRVNLILNSKMAEEWADRYV
jgi:methylglyoxal synthase